METTLVGTEIVERVADREGIDPVDLNDRLYDVIDADALETLTNTSDRQSQANLCVEFAYHGYAVTVVESGKIIIDEQPTETKTDESSQKKSVDD
ncbi:HalOD1 output domain-containing protein [Natrinema soli]|uniref:HalOD1 output domain-containing protein n=1 Tax=Natrinema soli TaxID=1930624 RepID=A0ABD5SQU1_9EURY|nr:HalOD1 output domain-containing protein [Natrinema soli]